MTDTEIQALSQDALAKAKALQETISGGLSGLSGEELERIRVEAQVVYLKYWTLAQLVESFAVRQ